MLGAERIEGLPLRRRRLRVEASERAHQEFTTRRDHVIEVAGPHGQRREWLEVAWLEPAVLHQALRADEQRIAGHRREALVRRVSVTRRTERQYLPHALTGLLEEVEKPMRLDAEIADAVAPGQRRRVQQQTAHSWGEHGAQYQVCGTLLKARPDPRLPARVAVCLSK